MYAVTPSQPDEFVADFLVVVLEKDGIGVFFLFLAQGFVLLGDVPEAVDSGLRFVLNFCIDFDGSEFVFHR